jgi:hypothetical protein
MHPTIIVLLTINNVQGHVSCLVSRKNARHGGETNMDRPKKYSLLTLEHEESLNISIKYTQKDNVQGIVV